MTRGNSLEFRNPNLLERLDLNRLVGGCNGARCRARRCTNGSRSEVVGQGLAIDLGLEGKDDGGASVSKVTEIRPLGDHVADLHDRRQVAALAGRHPRRWVIASSRAAPPMRIVEVVDDDRADAPKADGGHGNEAELLCLDDPHEALVPCQLLVPASLVGAVLRPGKVGMLYEPG
eukprot:scaffold60953_cov47-Phaeocystis_antarctica.AAC.3